MTTAKNKVFIELLLENCYLQGEMNFWYGRGWKEGRREGRQFGEKEVYHGENISWWRG